MVSEQDIGRRVACTAAHEAELAEEDRGDCGYLHRIVGTTAYVGWDSGVVTPIDVDCIEVLG